MAAFTFAVYHCEGSGGRTFSLSRPSTSINAPGLTEYLGDPWGQGRQSAVTLEIKVEGPGAFRRVVIITGRLPFIGRILAGEHDDDGTVVGQGGAAAPVFQQTDEIFDTTAVVGANRLDDAFKCRRVNGGGAGIT